MRIFLQTAASEAEFDFEKTSTPARNKASLPLGEAVCLAAISDTGSLAAAGSGEEVVPPARPHHLPQSHKRIDRIDTACRRRTAKKFRRRALQRIVIVTPVGMVTIKAVPNSTHSPLQWSHRRDHGAIAKG